jgi:hypothetical protein
MRQLFEGLVPPGYNEVHRLDRSAATTTTGLTTLAASIGAMLSCACRFVEGTWREKTFDESGDFATRPFAGDSAARFRSD